MIHYVDFSKPEYRWMFEILYQRVLSFALAYDWTEEDVKTRFTRLLGGDLATELIVDLDFSPDVKIKAHCLLNIEPPNVIVEQLKCDNAKDSSFTKYIVNEYLDKLAKKYSLTHAVASTNRTQAKALEKQYGFVTYSYLIKKELKTLAKVDNSTVQKE